MIWNFNISEAPKGKMITVMRNTKTKDGGVRLPTKEFEPDNVWLASKCGKVIKSYWIKSEKNRGRWAGLAVGEQPMAWQEFVVPTHPDQLAKLHKAADLTVEHLGIDDVGGQ